MPSPFIDIISDWIVDIGFTINNAHLIFLQKYVLIRIYFVLIKILRLVK